MDFFTKDEILFFASYANQSYDPKTQSAIGAQLRETVWAKTKYWVNAVAGELNGFDFRCKAVWQERNGSSGQKFKPYTWATLFKAGDKDKHIFFTLGVETEQSGIGINELRCKLDCRWSDGGLNEKQVSIAEAMLTYEVQWSNALSSIPANLVDNYGWNELISQSVEYIRYYQYLYDEIINSVWGNDDGRIIEITTAPVGIHKPKAKAGGKSTINRDDAKSKRLAQESLGQQGEQLVERWEKEELCKQGKAELAEKVHVLTTDGDGYDVISYFSDGREKYIEVKTTTGPSSTYFYLSENERLVAKEKGSQYQIYRLYDYNKKTGNARCVKFEHPEQQLMLLPIDYKVYSADQAEDHDINFWNNEWDEAPDN